MGTTLSQLDDEVRGYPDDESYGTGRTDYLGEDGLEDDYADDDYPDDDYDESLWPVDSRWRPVTAVLGAAVALGAIATAVIINSGDSASTKATVGAPVPRTMPSATSAPGTPAPKTTVPRTPAALPPETFTTVTTPNAAPSTVPTDIPTAAPPAVPTAAPPAAALNPRTVVYSVTGTKQLLDLVNVVYTDARGYPQTEFNVSLPWSKVIVLNPGVQTESVVATSFYGHLNCSILNAAGEPVIASANNGNLATCTR